MTGWWTRVAGCLALAGALLSGGAQAGTVADVMPSQEIRQAQVTTASGTRSVTLPHMLSADDFAPQGQLVRYRMTVDLPAAPTQAMGIAAAKISLAGRILLNGHDLGSCAPGDLDEVRCVFQPQWRHAGATLWRAGTNDIVVEVWATSKQANGLSTVHVGPARAVYDDYFWPRHFLQHDLVVAIQWCTLALGLIALVIGTVLQGHRIYLWFGLAATTRALSNFSSLVVNVWGDVFWTTWAMMSMRLLTLPFTILVVLAFFDRLSKRMERLLLGMAVAMPVLLALSGNSVRAALVLATPVSILALILVVRAGGWTWQSRHPRDVMLFFTVVILLGAGLHDMGVYQSVSGFHRPVLLPYTSGLLLLTIGGLMVARLTQAVRTTADINTILADKVAAHEADLLRKHQTILELERSSARVQERERFLRDLHDGLGSSLSAARIRLDDDSLTPTQVSQLLDECIDDMRLLIATSAPDSQFSDALGDLRYRMDRRLPGTGVQVQWRIALDSMPQIPAPARLQLMRVLQEALTNALRHSHASLITVHAKFDAQAHRLQVSVEDNGCGFDADHPPAGGRGLRHQRHRAGQLQATLEIHSSPQGTRVSLTWDVPR